LCRPSPVWAGFWGAGVALVVWKGVLGLSCIGVFPRFSGFQGALRTNGNLFGRVLPRLFSKRMSDAVLENVKVAVEGDGMARQEPRPTTPPLSSESLAKSLVKEFRTPPGGKGKESSGGAAPKPGATGSAEGSTVKAPGKDSSPGAEAGSVQSDGTGAPHPGPLPEGEGEAEGSASGEGEGAGGGDGSGTGKEVWPESANRTVTGLRAERRENRARLEALEKELQALKGNGTSGTSDLQKVTKETKGTSVPATGGTDAVPKELREAEAEKRQMRDWAREAAKTLRTNPDAVLAELDKHGVRVPDRTPEGLADFLAEVRENATTELAKLSARIELAQGQASQQADFERAQASQVANEYMPELADAESPRAKRFEQIMAIHPELKGHPRGPLAAMVQVLGMEALDSLMAQKKKNGRGPLTPALSHGERENGSAARPAPARLPNGSGPAPVVGSGRKVSSSDLLKVYQKSGLEADKTAWVKSALG
jgi:hypothetical protein